MESRIAFKRLLTRTANICLSEEHHGTTGAPRFPFDPTYSFRSLSDPFVEFDPV